MCDLVYHYSLTYGFGKVMLLNVTFLTLLLYEQILIIISYILAWLNLALRHLALRPEVVTEDFCPKPYTLYVEK